MPRLPRPHDFPRIVDAWALRRAHNRPERNPKAIAILATMVASLAPTALGLQPVPASMSAFPMLGQVATICSAFGCLMAVLGQLTWGKWRDPGLAVEIAGCIFLAAGMLFYVNALVLGTTQSQRAYVFGAALGIGIGSLLRAAQISLYVRGRRLAREEQARLES